MPGDFDGNQIIGAVDVRSAAACLNQLAAGTCAAADMNDDGYVDLYHYFLLENGADACPYVAPASECAADVNGDGWVTMEDLFAVRICFGLQPLGNCTHADLDGSGFVTMSDLLLVSGGVGTQACSQ